MPKKRDHGSGGLYQITRKRKLKDGTVKEYTLWRGVVDLGEDGQGKRAQPSVHATTQRECKRRLDKLMEEIREDGAPADKQATMAQWSARWLEEIAKPNVDPKTYRNYRTAVNRRIGPLLGKKKVHTIGPAHVRALRKYVIEDQGLSSTTAREAHITLNLILSAAVTERILRKNPAEGVKAPKAAKSGRGAIPSDQALSILRTAAMLPDASGSRWWFKLLGGQRQGEILGATLEDLDLDLGYYKVSWKLEALSREHGCDGGNAKPSCGKKRAAFCPDARWETPDGFEKRHLQGAWHLTRPKSQEHRIVPLIPQLAEAIRRYLAATAGQPNPHGLIWHLPDGSPITPKDDGAQWRDLLHAAGVITAEENKPRGTKLTGHVARHTVVTVLASLGVDTQLIGEIVGHSSTEVTEMYRHADQAEKIAAMAKLGTAWSDALGSVTPSADVPQIAP
jgi:integrase